MKAHKTEHKLAGITGEFAGLFYDTREIFETYKHSQKPRIGVKLANLCINSKIRIGSDTDYYPNNKF